MFFFIFELCLFANISVTLYNALGSYSTFHMSVNMYKNCLGIQIKDMNIEVLLDLTDQ